MVASSPATGLPSERTCCLRAMASAAPCCARRSNCRLARGCSMHAPSEARWCGRVRSWSQLDPVVLSWRRARQTKTLERSLDQLMDVRRIIEPAASALAAQHRTAKDLARVDAAWLGNAAGRRRGAGVRRCRRRVPHRLSRGSTQQLVFPLARVPHPHRVMTSMRVTNRDPGENQKVSLPLRSAIRDAIAARDPDAARLAMQRGARRHRTPPSRATK